MRKNKWLVVLCVLTAAALLFTACGSKAPAADTGKGEPQADTPKEEPAKAEPKKEEVKEVKLTVIHNAVSEWGQTLQTIADKFTQENPNITVDLQLPGKDYENIMKIKMASKDMPDAFATHGWAKIRYGGFLADLKGEEWTSGISPAIKDSVTDETGKVYVLPIDWEKGGLVYNPEILEKYDVEVPLTLDDFAAACETIKTKSSGAVIPVHVGAADDWMMGQIFDVFGTSMATSAAQNYRKELLDGTYYWSKFEPLPAKMLEMHKKGLFNKDILSAKHTDTIKAFAEGKAAFVIHGTWIGEEARKLNPNVKYGLMPVPSIIDGDEPTFAGGEKTTWGAWKDSKNLDVAKKFIAYYAIPENVKLVCQQTSLPSGLEGVQIDLGEVTPYLEKYSSIRVFTYFDREYLPNGMWDPMCKNGQDMFAGGITPKQFCENLAKEYDRLYKASKQQ